MKNCVYRFINKNNEIIYIGKTVNFKKRLNQHMAYSKDKVEEMLFIEYVEFETEHDMDLAERYLIPKHKPKYNKSMNSLATNLEITYFDTLKWKRITTDNKEYNLKTQKKCEEIDFLLERTHTLMCAVLDATADEQPSPSAEFDKAIGKFLDYLTDKEDELLKLRYSLINNIYVSEIDDVLLDGIWHDYFESW